jgi:hypothetical protein
MAAGGTTTSVTTIRNCYNADGSAVVVQANTVVVAPWYPEGTALPTPAQGAANDAKNLAQNTSPTQQPGLL